MAAFSKAFVNVALAEIFDKTWFVTLFMAIPYSKLASFLGAFSALAVHGWTEVSRYRKARVAVD